MKLLILCLASAFLTTTVYAGGITSGGDCFPEQLNLPNKGQNCSLLKVFTSEAEQREYQLWSCAENETAQLFLMKFRVGQNGEFAGCRVFEQIIKEN